MRGPGRGDIRVQEVVHHGIRFALPRCVNGIVRPSERDTHIRARSFVHKHAAAHGKTPCLRVHRGHRERVPDE